MPHIVFIGLGSNMEQPHVQLQQAFAELAELANTRVMARSSLYLSAPLGHLKQADFLNAVAKIQTALSPQDLLKALLKIELRHGRQRTFLNAPRTLDLDILLYDDVQLHESGLTIPHAQMHLRAFVLQPLLEIAPACVIPGIGAALQTLQNCQDQVVERLADVV